MAKVSEHRKKKNIVERIKRLFSTHRKPASTRKLASESFHPITILESIAASLPVGFRDGWKRGLSIYKLTASARSGAPRKIVAICSCSFVGLSATCS